MKKKMLAGLLIVCLCFCMFGCGDKEETDVDVKEPEATTEATVEPEATEQAAEQTAEASTWEVLTTNKFTFPLYNVGYSTKDVAMTVGYGGEIHYTEDGGKNWEQADNNSMCRFGLDFVDDKICYTCGNGGDVTKSTDGGKKHEKVTNFGQSEPNQCTMMSFSDENTGIAAAKGMIGLTKDGGKTWETIIPLVDIAGIRFVDASNFYFIGQDMQLYKTTDGGKTFNPTPLNLPLGDDYLIGTQKCALYVDGADSYTIFCYQKSTKQIKSYTTNDNWASCVENSIPETDKAALNSSLYLNHTGDILSSYNGTDKTVVAIMKK